MLPKECLIEAIKGFGLQVTNGRGITVFYRAERWFIVDSSAPSGSRVEITDCPDVALKALLRESFVEEIPQALSFVGASESLTTEGR